MKDDRVFYKSWNRDLKIVPAKSAFECPAYARYFRFGGLCDRKDVGLFRTRFQAYGYREGFDTVVFLR